MTEPQKPTQSPDPVQRWEAVFGYFLRPFPSGEGFSAYRSPGIAVHLPVLLVSFFLAVVLCGPHQLLWPFIPLYLLAGLYGGRDLAIWCHYAPLLTLIVWGVFFGLVSFGPDAIRSLQAEPTLHWIVSGLTSVAVLAGGVLRIRSVFRSADE